MTMGPTSTVVNLVKGERGFQKFKLTIVSSLWYNSETQTQTLPKFLTISHIARDRTLVVSTERKVSHH